MNKQGPNGIGWCDYTWNPVTGCWGPGGTAERPNRCSYCYAEKMMHRLFSMKGEPDAWGSDDPFQPTLWNDRLTQPRKVIKPAKIFVCSMGDLFGDWVAQEWIKKVLLETKINPQHIFQFLTKNPKRLKDFNPWSPNCLVGTTVTNQADADERLPWLLQVDAPVRFVSHEPLLGEIDVKLHDYAISCHRHSVRAAFINWAIIGAMTGPGAVKPKPEWIQGLINQYRAAGVPLFLKDNLNWPEKIKEWPE